MTIEKKKILVILADALNLGGIERSLLGLLDAFDYEKYEVDLFLYGHHGELYPLINHHVNILPEVKELAYLHESFLTKLKHGCWYSILVRIAAAINRNSKNGKLTESWIKIVRKYAPKQGKYYDLAISFNFSTDYLKEKVDADVKIGWIHTDYSSCKVNFVELDRNFSGLDYIAAVSEDCKKAFCSLFPKFEKKVFVVENILPKKLIETQSNAFSTSDEMPQDGSIRLLSIGRFCYPKRFDEIPLICRGLREKGLNIKWYLIGYGGDERLIRQKITEAGMDNYVIVLGKKENPYPYIKSCDLYVQPSRYEGKSVAVREAQILCKPVVITDYATSGSQLENGIDGVIIPMELESCISKLADIVQDKTLQERLIKNTCNRDYTNNKEVEKLYSIIHRKSD